MYLKNEVLVVPAALSFEVHYTETNEFKSNSLPCIVEVPDQYEQNSIQDP